MDDAVTKVRRTSGRRRRIEAIRHDLEDFVNGRLQLKLKYLGPDQREKREAIIEAHKIEVWLTDAARRAKRIQLATHTLKPIHPDAQGTNLYVAVARDTPGLVGTHNLVGQRTLDVVGNSNAMDVAKLLTDIKCDGRPLVNLILDHDSDLLAALSDDPECARSWCRALAGVADNEPGYPASHPMAKQMYFPLSEGGYHLLAPLFPTTLVHRAHQIIHESYFGTASVKAREAHRKNKPCSNGYSNYPDLAIRRLGGDSPQNISLLNSLRCGENWLLSSTPPVVAEAPPFPINLRSESIFDQDLANTDPIRTLIAEFQQCLLADLFNSPKLRPARKQLVREIGEEVIQYAAKLQKQPVGWTVNAPCQLNGCETTWLDPQRADNDALCGHGADWAAEISNRLAYWLADALNSKPSPFAGPRGGARANGLYEDLEFFREFLINARG